MIKTKRIIGFIPINPHRWQHPHKGGYGGVRDGRWHNMYFWEAVIDFEDLPPGTIAKLLVEFVDDKHTADEEGEIGVRLAYQPKPRVWVPFEGSEIWSKGGGRWLLAKSKWFKFLNCENMPEYYEPFGGVCLLWLQGTEGEDSDCAVAMVNIVLAVDE